MGKCTLPPIPWFSAWFNNHFEDLCYEHDFQYTRCCPYLKFRSDYIMSREMFKRGYPLLAFLTLIYNLTLGTIYWIFRRTQDLIKLFKRK